MIAVTESELAGTSGGIAVSKWSGDRQLFLLLIAHGYNDLACPYFMSKLVVAQMPLFGVPERVKVAVFPGGHMFYARNDSAAAFKRAAMEAYRAK